MTMAALPALSGAPAATRRRRRGVEFLAVGGATLLVWPLLWALRSSLGLDEAELVVGFLMFHAAVLINDPHFAVTYLLFYKDAKRRALGDAFGPAQRLRYVVAGFVVPLVLAVWAIGAVTSGSARALGGLMELMFLLVGWHYVKQGFGVLTVLSARDGVTFDQRERRVVLAHCYAGWAYAWATPARGAQLVEEKGVVYAALPHPAALGAVTGAVFAASALGLAWVLLRKWRRDGRLPPAAPLCGFLVSIWIWTLYTHVDPLLMYVIPALHSLQYLYFVALLRRNEAKEAEGPPHFGRPVAVRLGLLAVGSIALGWVAFHGLPGLLDEARRGASAEVLGVTPWAAALFAFVNLHHYFMDHVIWRRDNPETRYLLARIPEAP